MTLEEVCKKVRKMLPALFKKAYGRDLEASLKERGQELWYLGLDTKNKQYIDICGAIDPADLAIIQAKGYIDADAGYLANVQNTLDVNGKKLDFFLLNQDHFGKKSEFLEPLVVHELAHLLDHIGEAATPEGNDDANADVIIKSLKRNILHHHPKNWALHLAGAGRRLINEKLTNHKTIRAYLEAAIPEYDRDGPIYAKKGP
jgi:hypothetical protein